MFTRSYGTELKSTSLSIRTTPPPRRRARARKYYICLYSNHIDTCTHQRSADQAKVPEDVLDDR